MCARPAAAPSSSGFTIDQIGGIMEHAFTPAPRAQKIALTWFAENDPEGVAFEYEVLE